MLLIFNDFLSKIILLMKIKNYKKRIAGDLLGFILTVYL